MGRGLERREREGGREGVDNVRWKNSSVTKSMVQFTSFSMPKKSSSGRPVSLQTGKGMYCRWPAASVIFLVLGARISVFVLSLVEIKGFFMFVVARSSMRSVFLGGWKTYMFTGFSGISISLCFFLWNRTVDINLHGSVQAADRNWLPRVVSSLLLQATQRLLAAQCRGERAEEGEERDGWKPGSRIRFRWHCCVGAIYTKSKRRFRM